ncbi:MAG: NusG domain II-containing protein [Eubacteriales bacterium]|nr:NusG domain II-containing protein [Eubacteriales bacterium]
MKKKDLMLAGGICAAAVLLWLFLHFFLPGTNNMIRITVDGSMYGEYSLDEDQVIRIGDTNVCEIKGGKARMTEADCPDQLCVHQKAVGTQGGTIVCLPNKVVIEAERIESQGEENVIDAVACRIGVCF